MLLSPFYCYAECHCTEFQYVKCTYTALSAIMLSVNTLSVVDSLAALLTNVRLGYDGWLGTKHSSLFVQSISDE